MGIKSARVSEQVREFRFEIRQNIVNFFQLYKDDMDVLTELFNEWGNRPEEIGRALQNIETYDIADLVRLNFAVERVAARNKKRRTEEEHELAAKSI